MKIVAITDKEGSAIDRLARMNAKRLEHLQYVVCPLHPKRPDPKEIEELRRQVADADLIDVQYWKSGVKANEVLGGFKIPTVLTHHNEHNINDTARDHWPWKDVAWTAHACKNGWQRAELKKQGIDATLIRHSIEWDNFSYAEKLTEERVVGYVGQMKKVKGVRQIAQACKELGYKLLLAGSVSEAEYFAEVRRDFEGTIVTHYPGTLAVPDNDIGRFYHKMRAYCANSDDGTESGTMPILEAMASGIPVVTRRIGLVRDCGENGKNMRIREGGYQDVEDLKAALKSVVESQEAADRYREAAWRTARQYHPEIQAREYDKLFRKTLFPKQRPVSVIMPSCGRNQNLFEALAALNEQSYRNFELVIGDDNFGAESGEIRSWLIENRGSLRYAAKHVWTVKIREGYGLAKARNTAIIEATGEILVFCDDRLRMHPQAIESFVAALERAEGNRKTWVWGSKGVFKNFVENFSAAWRRQVVDGGMFNERIDRYGGMTQEVSARFNAQGFRFDFCPGAVAEAAFGTHSRSRHREDIVASKIRLYKMGFQ